VPSSYLRNPALHCRAGNLGDARTSLSAAASISNSPCPYRTLRPSIHRRPLRNQREGRPGPRLRRPTAGVACSPNVLLPQLRQPAWNPAAIESRFSALPYGMNYTLRPSTTASGAHRASTGIPLYLQNFQLAPHFAMAFHPQTLLTCGARNLTGPDIINALAPALLPVRRTQLRAACPALIDGASAAWAATFVGRSMSIQTPLPLTVSWRDQLNVKHGASSTYPLYLGFEPSSWPAGATVPGGSLRVVANLLASLSTPPTSTPVSTTQRPFGRQDMFNPGTVVLSAYNTPPLLSFVQLPSAPASSSHSTTGAGTHRRLSWRYLNRRQRQPLSLRAQFNNTGSCRNCSRRCADGLTSRAGPRSVVQPAASTPGLLYGQWSLHPPPCRPTQNRSASANASPSTRNALEPTPGFNRQPGGTIPMSSRCSAQRHAGKIIGPRGGRVIRSAGFGFCHDPPRPVPPLPGPRRLTNRELLRSPRPLGPRGAARPAAFASRPKAT
jgi:hypothetical protein